METHAHADHFSAAPYLRETLGGKIAIGAHIPDVQKVFGGLFNKSDDFARNGAQFDTLFKDGERFQIGEVDAKVIMQADEFPPPEDNGKSCLKIPLNAV